MAVMARRVTRSSAPRRSMARVVFFVAAALAVFLHACSSHTMVVAADGDAEEKQTFTFQTEVARMMDIIINSLYSNRDVFLRELISNASDATDKIRLLSLTNPDVLGEGESAELEIFVSVDHDNGILKIRDRGIGMTRDDLVNNLGTIAKSGTSTFADKLAKEGGAGGDLIGQFGVGFYSVYLVADTVSVVSKHNDDEDQWVWESNAGGQFTIEKDLPENYPDGEGYVDLKRGTELRIKLRDDVAEEYGDEDVLMKLIKRYSEFINFPINLRLPGMEEVLEKEVKPKKAKTDAVSDDEDTEEEEEEDDDEPEFRTVYHWHQVNTSKSVWTQSSANTTPEEYDHLYKILAKSGNIQAQTYLDKAHFQAEGDVEFKAVIYIPDRPNDDFKDNQKEKAAAKVKLYVRRVFITDSFEDLIPPYLGWIVGVVDSDSLPLNVSRETLQQHSAMKTIKKKLARKALDIIKKIKEDNACYNDETIVNNEGKEECKYGKTKYDHFWENYKAPMKYGFVNDNKNRSRIIKLLRFKTSKSNGVEIGLDEYEARAKPTQKNIYYVAEANGNLENILKSPGLEMLMKKGYEVLFLTEAIDEWIMQAGFDYNEMKFMNANTEDLKLAPEDDIFEGKMDMLKKKYRPFFKWWKAHIRSIGGVVDLEDVRISNRLEDSPATVVNTKFSTSANMDRILSSQFNENKSRIVKTILEVNLRHPIVKQIHTMFEEEEKQGGPSSGSKLGAKDMAIAVFQTSLVSSGYEFNKKMFTDHVFGFLSLLMGIPDDAKVDETFDLGDYIDDGEKVHVHPMTGEEITAEEAKLYEGHIGGEYRSGFGDINHGVQEPDAPDPEQWDL